MAQNYFLEILNKYGWKNQYQILLGLCLHTLQDFYAHCVRVNKCIYSDNGVGKYKNLFKGSRALTTVNYLITKYQTDQIEDNSNFLDWRYTKAETASGLIYRYFKDGTKIKSINSTYLFQSSITFYVHWIGNIGYYKAYPPKKPYTKYKMNYTYIELSFIT